MYLDNSNISVSVEDGKTANTKEVTFKFTVDSDKEAVDKLFFGTKKQTCKICGAVGEFKTWRIVERSIGTGDKFNYFECPECETLQIEEFPPDIGKYYSKSYYSYAQPQMPPPLPNFPKDYRRVLDVGSGSGNWLCSLIKYGYVNLDGCDPFIEKDLSYTNGVKIYKKSIHEMDGKYDIIQFNDSFEHMSDPFEVLTSADRLLKQSDEKTGNNEPYIEFVLPVYPCLAIDIYGMHSFAVDAAYHFFLYSVKTLESLMEQRGFYLSSSTPHQIRLNFYRSRGFQFKKTNQELLNLYNSGLLFEGHIETEAIFEALTHCVNAAKVADEFVLKFQRR